MPLSPDDQGTASREQFISRHTGNAPSSLFPFRRHHNHNAIHFFDTFEEDVMRHRDDLPDSLKRYTTPAFALGGLTEQEIKQSDPQNRPLPAADDRSRVTVTLKNGKSQTRPIPL